MEEDSDDVDKGTTTNKQLGRDDYNGTQKTPHQRSLLRGKKDENNETIASDSQLDLATLASSRSITPVFLGEPCQVVGITATTTTAITMAGSCAGKNPTNEDR